MIDVGHRHLAEEVIKLQQENTRLRAALEKISAIRDSIIGRQGFHFSDHAYPLVAALDGAGFPGAGYEIASKNEGHVIDENRRLRAALEWIKNRQPDGVQCGWCVDATLLAGEHEDTCPVTVARKATR